MNNLSLLCQGKYIFFFFPIRPQHNSFVLLLNLIVCLFFPIILLNATAIHRVGMTRLFSGADINGNLDSTTTFTLFVPVNEAMVEAGFTFDTIKEIDIETLQNIIKSHIMIGSMKVEDLICGAQYESMLSSTIGEDNPVYSQTLLKVDCLTILKSKTKSISGFYNTDLKNQPKMLSPNDIRLCNGYVQPIDHIIQS